ncbi:MAG: tetratricopeptide repeat protein [Acidobacteriota bacterium]|nr:tetratricopeptide repeat protein [Acidobacteriota bacterium]
MRDLLLASLLTLAAVSAAAQLPAGTRDAADNSRVDAANAKLRDAEAALERGDFTAAAKTLQALSVERPKDAQILYDLGFADERIGDDAGAAKAYETAIAASPEVPEPRVALGLLNARAGQADKAHSELAEVTRMDTASPQLKARALRALAHLDEATHPTDAGEELLAAVKLTGETPEDTAFSAALAERSGDTAGAEAAYRRVLQLHPEDLDAAVGLAHILQQTNRAAEAEAALTEPLKAHPNDPRLVSQMASIYAAAGNAKQAIPLLLQLSSDPKFATDAALTRQLARLYALDGQNVEAEQMYKAALAKDSHDPTVLDDLGSVLVLQQKYPEAEQVLAAAVAQRDRFPNSEAFGEAAGHLAFAHSKAGHPRETLQALALRATVLPNSAPALFLEATAHDTLQEVKEAERAYRAFLAIAAGMFPDQEFQARHRLIALEHTK